MVKIVKIRTSLRNWPAPFAVVFCLLLGIFYISDFIFSLSNRFSRVQQHLSRVQLNLLFYHKNIGCLHSPWNWNFLAMNWLTLWSDFCPNFVVLWVSALLVDANISELVGDTLFDVVSWNCGDRGNPWMVFKFIL